MNKREQEFSQQRVGKDKSKRGRTGKILQERFAHSPAVTKYQKQRLPVDRNNEIYLLPSQSHALQHYPTLNYVDSCPKTYQPFSNTSSSNLSQGNISHGEHIHIMEQFRVQSVVSNTERTSFSYFMGATHPITNRPQSRKVFPFVILNRLTSLQFPKIASLHRGSQIQILRDALRLIMSRKLRHTLLATIKRESCKNRSISTDLLSASGVSPFQTSRYREGGVLNKIAKGGTNKKATGMHVNIGPLSNLEMFEKRKFEDKR